MDAHDEMLASLRGDEPPIGPSALTDVLAAERPGYNSVVAGQLLCIRDALVAEDYHEAYHLLYLIADPNLSSLEPWAEMERIAKAANYGGKWIDD